MDLSLLLIVLGILVAFLTEFDAIGGAMILIGLVLLLWPRLRAL